MENIWNEERIRLELARLDKKTGLMGATLPIHFTHAMYTLGSFSNVAGGAFKFSNYYFQNPDWPVETALDVIRHEYAHYMEYEFYGNGGHGKTWKKCCSEIGAMAMTYYSDIWEQHIIQRYKEEKEKMRRYDTYYKGEGIVHPKFGSGVIEEITGKKLNRRVIVDFPRTGKKKLGMGWVDQHCKRVKEA